MGASASRELLLELRMTDAVRYAAIQGDLKKLQLILPLPNVKDADGYTVLHIACWYGHYRIVEHFAKLQLVDVNAPARPGRVTPLLLACWGGHANCVKVLLSHGAAPNDGYDASGNTPLTAALHRGRWTGTTCELSGVRHFHGPRYRALAKAMCDVKAHRYFDLCEEMFVKAAGQLPVATDWLRYERPGDNFPRHVTLNEVKQVERARAKLRRRGLNPEGAGYDLRTEDERLADFMATQESGNAVIAPLRRFGFLRTCVGSFSVQDTIASTEDAPDDDAGAARARQRPAHSQEKSDPVTGTAYDPSSAGTKEQRADDVPEGAFDKGAAARMLGHQKREKQHDGLATKGSTTLTDNTLLQKLEDRLTGLRLDGAKHHSQLGLEEEHAKVDDVKGEMNAEGLQDLVRGMALKAPQRSDESKGAFRWRKAKATFQQPSEDEMRGRRRRRLDAQFLDVVLMLVEAGAKCDIVTWTRPNTLRSTTLVDEAAQKYAEEGVRHTPGALGDGIVPALLALGWEDHSLIVLEALEKGGAQFDVKLGKPFKGNLALQAADWGRTLEAQWIMRRGVDCDLDLGMIGVGQWFNSMQTQNKRSRARGAS